MLASVRRTVQEVDPRLRVLRVESVWRQRSRELGSPVLGSFVLVIFGTTGVLLSILGGMGHVSKHLTREAPSIAMRQALGAEPGALQWEVVKRTALATTAGLAAGLGGGFLLTRVLMNRIPWVASPETVLILGPAALLGLALWAAAAVVAWRELRSSPWGVLKAL
ncbi:MAG: hypothetical protein OYL41_06855 [Acidobacteriota bacterium]|nr:hypothetical protein [Acidobacteriota bacterium]